MLQLSTDDLRGFLTKDVSISVGFEDRQLRSSPVVFPEPQRMHGDESRLFVGPVVTSQETGVVAVLLKSCALGGRASRKGQ